jgi:hypothetical protein
MGLLPGFACKHSHPGKSSAYFRTPRAVHFAGTGPKKIEPAGSENLRIDVYWSETRGPNLMPDIRGERLLWQTKSGE